MATVIIGPGFSLINCPDPPKEGATEKEKLRYMVEMEMMPFVLEHLGECFKQCCDPSGMGNPPFSSKGTKISNEEDFNEN